MFKIHTSSEKTSFLKNKKLCLRRTADTKINKNAKNMWFQSKTTSEKTSLLFFLIFLVFKKSEKNYFLEIGSFGVKRKKWPFSGPLLRMRSFGVNTKLDQLKVRLLTTKHCLQLFLHFFGAFLHFFAFFWQWLKNTTEISMSGQSETVRSHSNNFHFR